MIRLTRIRDCGIVGFGIVGFGIWDSGIRDYDILDSGYELLRYRHLLRRSRFRRPPGGLVKIIENHKTLIKTSTSGKSGSHLWDCGICDCGIWDLGLWDLGFGIRDVRL